MKYLLLILSGFLVSCEDPPRVWFTGATCEQMCSPLPVKHFEPGFMYVPKWGDVCKGSFCYSLSRACQCGYSR